MHDDQLGTFYQVYYIDGTRDDFPIEAGKMLVKAYIENANNVFTFSDIAGRQITLRPGMICSIAISTPESREAWRVRNCLYDEASERVEKERRGQSWL